MTSSLLQNANNGFYVVIEVAIEVHWHDSWLTFCIITLTYFFAFLVLNMLWKFNSIERVHFTDFLEDNEIYNFDVESNAKKATVIYLTSIPS